jgi:poly-gamma-glutamate system protein
MVGRLWLLLAATVLFLALCQPFMLVQPTLYQNEKQAALALAQQAQALLGMRISGPEYTLITTTLAPPEAKRLSLHPDFAAVAAGWLKQAGIGPGSRVAVNLSGSFPALNIAVLAAIRAVGAEPVITVSVGASTWGATDPEFTWLDMEGQLQQAGLLPWRAAAASIGGVGDNGGGLTPEGKELALAAIRRSGAPLLAAPDLRTAIERRLDLYRGADRELPAVLVNVGGSHVLFGEAGHRAPLPQGLNRGYHPLLAAQDGLAAAFLQTNRPVIHFLNIRQLAAQYGIAENTPAGTSGAFLSRQLPLPLRLVGAVWLALVFILLKKNFSPKQDFWFRRSNNNR